MGENFSLHRGITFYQNETKSPLPMSLTCPSCIGGPLGESKREEIKGVINKRETYVVQREEGFEKAGVS